MRTVSLLTVAALLRFVSHAQELKFETPVPLPEIINSDVEELQPVFNTVRHQLYFVRSAFARNSKDGKQDQEIWMAVHDSSGNWISVHAVEELNNKDNNGIFGFSADYKTAYLVNSYLKKKHHFLKGVAVADEKGEGWVKRPETLEIEGFELSGDHYSFYLGHKDDIIIISEFGPDSRGMEDLYISRKNEQGVWGKPVHMGANINSEGFEISPFLTESEDTLFFTSSGHGGYGNADIFYSVRHGDGWDDWSDPVNVGEVINSDKFDAYFILAENGAYFSSNRSGNNQIYHAMYLPPAPILCSVSKGIDPTAKGVNDGTVTVSGLEPGVQYDKLIYFKDDTGEEVSLSGLSASPEGKITIQNLYEGRYHDMTIYLSNRIGACSNSATLIAPEPVAVVTDPVVEPVVVIEPVRTSGPQIESKVLFELNSSFLDRQAIKNLHEILTKIKATSGYKIEIIAHTDYRETERYNIWLSERRMQRVKDWFVANGVSESVVSGMFKGESELLNKCEDCDEEIHHQNRRATIRVYY